MKFTKSINLKCHINDVHLNLKKFDCPLCNNTFKRKYAVERHIKRVHPLIVKEKVQCHIYNRKFSRKDSLVCHKEKYCKAGKKNFLSHGLPIVWGRHGKSHYEKGDRLSLKQGF